MKSGEHWNDSLLASNLRVAPVSATNVKQ